MSRKASLLALLALFLGASRGADAWTARDVLPYPNYSDEFSPVPSLPDGERLRIQQLKYPTLGLPQLLRPGDELKILIDVDQDPAGSTLWLVGLRLRSHRPTLQKVLDLRSAAVITKDLTDDLFLISVTLPTQDVPYDLYDLEIEASTTGPNPFDCAAPPEGSFCDSQPRSVKILGEFRQDFTFVHLSDVHQGDPRGTSDNQYRQYLVDGIIKTLNFVQPEFVVISGDLAYGQDYSHEFPASIATFQQARFPTFAVPGNHDQQRNVFLVGLNDGYDYYRAFWGPPYYSFDYGALHMVGIDSMERPKEDREIGVGSGGVLAEFGGGIDLDATGKPLPQLAWLEQDLERATQAGKTPILYQHHDPAKDYTPGFQAHDVWDFDTPEYAESSDLLRSLLGQFSVPYLLVGHDHYDEVRQVMGTRFVMTTTTASEARFGATWGYRLFKVSHGQVASYGYHGGDGSVPYGYSEDPNHPDPILPYVDYAYNGANDGTTATASATVRNGLQDPVSGRLEFFVSGFGNQASQGKILQEAAVEGAVRVLVEVSVPPLQTAGVQVQPATARPVAPAEVTARVTESTIRLEWSPVLDTDVLGYRVYVSPSGSRGPRTLVADLPLSSFQDPLHPGYEIEGLATGSRLTAAVSAYDAALESEQTASDALLLHAPPASPQQFRATAEDRALRLSFEQPDGDAVAWYVYYGSGDGINLTGTDALEGPSPVRVTHPTARLSGLTNGVVYTVAVTALDSSFGESGPSAFLQVRPEPFPSADLDADGKTDASDRHAILRTQARLASLDGEYATVADLNGNHRIDIGDAVLADSLVQGRGTPPSAKLKAQPPTLQAGANITFDASGSRDRESLPEALEYRFDFDGSGVFTAWSPSPSATHVYPDASPRSVVLEARDPDGLIGRAVLHYLPKAATHVFFVDIDGCRRDVFYRWIAGAGGGHRALRDDILGSISFGGTNGDDAYFAGSSAVGSNYCRALFPTVTFVNQAAIPMGQYPRTHGISGNEMFDRDLLFERSFVAADAQSVYTEGKALATLWPAARSIYEEAQPFGLASSVLFHQYPKGASSFVSPTTPEFATYLLDPAQKFDQVAFYRSLQELAASNYPPIAYLYYAGLDHRSHKEGIESQDPHLELLDGFFETLIHGGTFVYPDITFPGSTPAPLEFPGLENVPDPATADPDDSILDNSIFCFTADHGQNNYGDTIVNISNITLAIQQYFDANATVVRHIDPNDPDAGGPRTGDWDPATLDAATVVAELNGPSMYLYIKNRSRGTWAGYPDFENDVLPMARAFAKANTDERTDNIEDGVIRDILVRKTGSHLGRDYSEGYLAYRWNGQSDELYELEDYFPPELDRATNVIANLRGLESRRSGDVILTTARPTDILDTDREGPEFGSPIGSLNQGEHGNWTPGESLIPQVCGGPPVRRLNLQKTEPYTSQIDMAPTAAQFLGISMDSADGHGYLYDVPPPAPPMPTVRVLAQNGAANAGDDLDVLIQLSGGSGVSALKASLRLDPERFELLGVEAANAATMGELLSSHSGANGELSAVFEPLGPAASDLLLLKLHVPQGAPGGTGWIRLQDLEVADTSGRVQPATGVAGEWTITEAQLSVHAQNLWKLLAAAFILAGYGLSKSWRAGKQRPHLHA